MTATSDPNVEAARLRRAQELLDERPSPKVRAAVMRAAAEAAGHSAADNAIAPRRASARRWFEWGPVAATAGGTAIALLAVGVAIHVDRIESTGAQSRSAAPAAPRPAMPAPSPSPAAAAAPPSPANSPPAPASDAAREATLDGKPRTAPLRSFSAVPPPAPAKPRAFAPAPPPSATAPAPASAKAGSTADEAKLQEEPAPRQPMMQAPAMGTAAPQTAQPMAPAAETRSSNAGQSARMKAAKEPLRQSMAPDDWLRRIIELRHAGRNAEADDELVRFRAAYPNASIPPEALR